VNVLNHCRKRGIKVVYATARRMKQVKDFTMKIPVDAVIAINGAIIYVDDEIAIEHIIPENTNIRFYANSTTPELK